MSIKPPVGRARAAAGPGDPSREARVAKAAATAWEEKCAADAHFLARVILGVVEVVRGYRLRTAGWKTSWPACATLKNPRATRRSAVRRG